MTSNMSRRRHVSSARLRGTDTGGGDFWFALRLTISGELIFLLYFLSIDVDKSG